MCTQYLHYEKERRKIEEINLLGYHTYIPGNVIRKVPVAILDKQKCHFFLLQNQRTVWQNRACKNFIDDVCIYVHHSYWTTVFFLFVVSFSVFGIKLIMALENDIGSVLSLSIFGGI
jgi:hypothetical protein